MEQERYYFDLCKMKHILQKRCSDKTVHKILKMYEQFDQKEVIFYDSSGPDFGYVGNRLVPIKKEYCKLISENKKKKGNKNMENFKIGDDVIYEKNGIKIEGKINNIIKEPDEETIVGYIISDSRKRFPYIVNPNNIKKKRRNYESISVKVSNNITTVKVVDSYRKISKGTAICAPDDKFDITFGIMLATARATGNKEVEKILIAQSYRK